MFLRIILAATLLCLLGCSDFIHPVKSTPEPTEYSFNYWLLQKIYLYEDELPNLSEEGDSAKDLYATLKDPFTTYTPPAKSEERATQISTSKIIGGDIGLRYYNITDAVYPIYIARVYPQSPAGSAGIPRFGNILRANGIELNGERAFATYDSIRNYSKNIDLVVAYKKDTSLYKLEKEIVYAPTVFVDTLFDDSTNGYPGIVFVSIEGFKDSTADRKNGTYGELKSYLDSTISDKRVRVLDLRNNPGGLVRQCLKMADLFVSKGTLSTRHSRSLDADGETYHIRTSEIAKSGDVGESGKFIILANRGSASASEIFIAAVTETTDIPFVGNTTYGKGVGQTTFFTYNGALATITNFEFLTPKGNSYHKEGIHPKYECSATVYENCAAQIANKIYGVQIPNQNESLAKKSAEISEQNTSSESKGEAFIWADSDFYLKHFQKSLR